VTLTVEQVIQHTVDYLSSTCLHISNLVEIGKLFCGQTEVQ